MNAAGVIAALDAVSTLLEFINEQARKARERGEWTPEEEAEYDAKATKVYASPEFQRKD
jgi:hypothetical protein